MLSSLFTLHDFPLLFSVHITIRVQHLFRFILCFFIVNLNSDLSELDLDEMFSVRNEDELRELTERLHSYISKIRDLRMGATTVDVHGFFKVK